MARAFYLISYDISNNKHRNKVAQLLEGYGERVQYSVFEVWATAQEMEKLSTRLERYVTDEGSVRIYALCAACRERREILGEGEPTEEATICVI